MQSAPYRSFEAPQNRPLTVNGEPHQFNFDELTPGAGSNQQPYFRVLLFCRKRPEVSYDQFRQWWKTVHADLTVSGKDFGVHVYRYVQFHPEMKWNPLLTSTDLKVLPFDGFGEFHVDKFEGWTNFTMTDSYKNVLTVDAANYLIMPIHVMAGYDHLIYGTRIATSGGRNGILPNDPRLNGKQLVQPGQPLSSDVTVRNCGTSKS